VKALAARERMRTLPTWFVLAACSGTISSVELETFGAGGGNAAAGGGTALAGGPPERIPSTRCTATLSPEPAVPVDPKVGSELAPATTLRHPS
jgi:hypothetical protein